MMHILNNQTTMNWDRPRPDAGAARGAASAAEEVAQPGI
jgi:hypothetical protein